MKPEVLEPVAEKTWGRRRNKLGPNFPCGHPRSGPVYVQRQKYFNKRLEKWVIYPTKVCQICIAANNRARAVRKKK